MSPWHIQKDVNKILTLLSCYLSGSREDFLSRIWPSPLKIFINFSPLHLLFYRLPRLLAELSGIRAGLGINVRFEAE